MSGSTWRRGCRACATSTRCWTPPCCKSTSTSLCSPPWGLPGLPPLSAPLRRRPLQWWLLPLLPAPPALRPPPHPRDLPHQPLNLKSLQRPSRWAPRSCLRMGSLTQRSSVAAVYKSWSRLWPTDTAPVLAPAPTLSSPCWNVSATKCQLPVCLCQGTVPPALRRSRWHPLGQVERGLRPQPTPALLVLGSRGGCGSVSPFSPSPGAPCSAGAVKTEQHSLRKPLSPTPFWEGAAPLSPPCVSGAMLQG